MKPVVIGVTLAMALLMVLLSCTAESAVKIDKIVELKPVEIREYEGENLSSINDFRENSIKGPQYIDIENYQLEVTGLIENPVTWSQPIN